MSSAESKPDIVQTNEPDDGGVRPEKQGNASRRYILILLQAGGRRDPLGYLDRVVLQLLWRKLDAKVQGERDRTEIDVWLESAGGDAHAAYKLFLDLRSRASKIRVVIPDFAKSAATLFVLGTDEVHMGPAAELGPLDMQMEHPDREGIWISALDATRALHYVAEFASEYIVEEGGHVHDRTGLPRLDVLREFSRFAALFFRPLVAKLDPQLIHQAANGLDVGRRYAVYMLERRNLGQRDRSVGQEEDCSRIARHFVEDYPAHEFAISRDEAASHGLPIYWAEEYNLWGAVKQVWQAFRSGLFFRESAGEPTATVLEVLSEEDMPGFIASLPGGNNGGDSSGS